MRSPHTVMKSSPRLLQLEEAHVQPQRPSTAKTNKEKKMPSKKTYILAHYCEISDLQE